MTSHLTIDDLAASTRDSRRHLPPTDLDTTADLPNESTVDLLPAAVSMDASPAAEPLVPEPPPKPPDEQHLAPMPRKRAFGFFAFAACALVAIFVTTVPHVELPAFEAPPPTLEVQSPPISTPTRVAEIAPIAQAPEPAKMRPASATPEVARGGAPASLIAFASRSLVTSEKAVAAVFIIKRTKAATGKAVVRWSARSGSADAGIDFSDASGTVRFADGQRQVAIYVPLRNDLLKEGDETFKVCLRSPQQARISGASCAETTIRDDDSDAAAPT